MASDTSSVTFDSLRRDIRSGRLAKVYFLHGEESFFIDELLKLFVESIPEQDRDFSLHTLYASETEPQPVTHICRSFPMMTDRQTVILKDIQSYSAKEKSILIPYVENPADTTVFVIASRGVSFKADDLMKAVKKGGGIIFEAKKLKSPAVPSLVQSISKGFGLNIELKGINMLSDYIGTDAARLYNEIEKMAMILGQGATITPEAIERNIGISKDYNNFELVDALAVKDAAKAMKTVRYFAANPKENPFPQTASAIFNYFSNLLIAHFTRDKSPGSLIDALGLRWPSQLVPIEKGMRNYNAWQVIEIIAAIRKYDAQSKGVGSRQNAYDLLQDLIYHILTAPGKLPV